MSTLQQRTAGAKRAARSMEATVTAGVEQVKAERNAHYQEAKAAAAEREANRIHYTAGDLKGAAIIKTIIGWHRVVKVNAKTVTVHTPYSWTDRIAIHKILDHKAASSTNHGGPNE